MKGLTSGSGGILRVGSEVIFHVPGPAASFVVENLHFGAHGDSAFMLEPGQVVFDKALVNVGFLNLHSPASSPVEDDPWQAGVQSSVQL